MPFLKESESLEAIRSLHRELWHRLEEQPEEYAERYLQSCIKELGRKGRARNRSAEFKELISVRGFLAALAVGLLFTPAMCCLIVWAALWVE